MRWDGSKTFFEIIKKNDKYKMHVIRKEIFKFIQEECAYVDETDSTLIIPHQDEVQDIHPAIITDNN